MLRIRRLKLKLTERQFGKLIGGLHHSVVQDYEKGESRPYPKNIFRVAELAYDNPEESRKLVEAWTEDRREKNTPRKLRQRIEASKRKFTNRFAIYPLIVAAREHLEIARNGQSSSELRRLVPPKISAAAAGSAKIRSNFCERCLPLRACDRCGFKMLKIRCV